MAPTDARFQMPTKDLPLLIILAFFYWWYSESNTTELEHDLYYTGLVCIHKYYAKFATKSKTSKIVGFKEYLDNLSNLR